MESALIISPSEKGISFFTEMLKAVSCNKIASVSTCGSARRLLLERNFDLCIINAPLSDEQGQGLACDIASGGKKYPTCQVILIVSSEYYDALSASVEDFGVITIAKPLNKALFWSILKTVKAVHKKVHMLQTENTKLNQKIEDIRIVDRAKCILISCYNYTEQEAHKYIEKQAMDMRITKRLVAEGILKKYESE